MSKFNRILSMLRNWHLLIFSNPSFSENHFMNDIKNVKQFGPRSGPDIVRPDLGPNCLQRLTADDTRGQRVNIYIPNVFIKTLHIKPV